MTSSLVGSEMCIRDRRRTTSGAVATLRACCPRLAMSLPVSQRCPGGAVSYTHLTLPTICSV
eukprot:10556448-Prorocentrum_lima.AAC.1